MINPLINQLTWSSPFENSYITAHGCFICLSNIKLTSKIQILAQVFHQLDDKKIAVIAHHDCVLAHDSAETRAICLQRAGLDTGSVLSQWYDELKEKYDRLSKEVALLEDLILTSKPTTRFRSAAELESYCAVKTEIAKPLSEEKLKARIKHLEEHPPMQELDTDGYEDDEDGNYR